MFLRIGTRKSKLALIQTELVIKELRKAYPEIECEIITYTTTGDKITNRNLYDIGGKALFLKELEEGLIRKEIDLAVHSLKDAPGNLSTEFEITAVLERQSPFEVFVSKNFKSIQDLPYGAIVGTSSIRRKCFLNAQRPDLQVVTFRGNVDSRVDRVLKEEIDATILTAAGLYRLGLFNELYCNPIPLNKIIPSPCQGIIGIEILKSNYEIKELCSKINHIRTFNLIKTERAFLKYLNANCTTPLAAFAYYKNENQIEANFMLAIDLEISTHSTMKFHKEIGKIEEADKIGTRAAKALLSKIS